MTSAPAFYGSERIKTRVLKCLQTQRGEKLDYAHLQRPSVAFMLDKAHVEWPGPLVDLAERLADGAQQLVANSVPDGFVRAIQPGADLDVAVNQFALWLLTDANSPLAEWQDKEWVGQAASLFTRRVAGDEPESQQWFDALMTAEEADGLWWKTTPRSADQHAARAVVHLAGMSAKQLPDIGLAAAQSAHAIGAVAEQQMLDATLQGYLKDNELPEDPAEKSKVIREALLGSNAKERRAHAEQRAWAGH